MQKVNIYLEVDNTVTKEDIEKMISQGIKKAKFDIRKEEITFEEEDTF